MPAVAGIGQRHGWSQHVHDHVHSTLRSLIATDLEGHTFTIPRGRRALDQLTKDAITSYLTYRSGRWPLTANRHLLLSRLSALQDGPVSESGPGCRRVRGREAGGSVALQA